MKSLTNYILEKLQINKDSKVNHKMKALPQEYIDAIIEAYMKSPFGKDVIKIDVTDAQDFFDNNEYGKEDLRINGSNYTYLYNRQYPALTVTFKGNNSLRGIPKLDTIMKRMPSIHMPLVLKDCEDLFTDRNSSNITGLRDIENAYVAFNAINKFNVKNGEVPSYQMTIIYVIKPKATEKLLPVDIFKSNLLKFYKMKDKEKTEHLEKIGKDFYIDDRRNKNGWLELDNERRKECEDHMKDTWDDEKQQDRWKWSAEDFKKINNKL